MGAGRITWDADTERYYETGVDRGVLYVKGADGYEDGVGWDGLENFTESPSGAEETELWANNAKYGSLRSAEKYGCTIEAYQCPREFYPCNGVKVVNGVMIGQQERSAFGMTYRTKVGNDVTADAGYIIHIVYGLTVSPSERAYQTINDSPEAASFSWEASSTPANVTINDEVKKTSSIEIDTRTLEGGMENDTLKELENMLYGTDAVTGTNAAAATAPTLPTPDQVIAMFAE